MDAAATEDIGVSARLDDFSADLRATEINSMRVFIKLLCGVAGGLLLLSIQTTCAFAANAYPVVTDINIGPQAFGVANASSFGGIYTLNDTATLNGNAVLRINQKGQLAGC